MGTDPAASSGNSVREVVDACRRAFSHEEALTVGFEEESILIEPSTLLPVDDVNDALARLEDHRFTCELRSSQLEVRTRPGSTVGDACSELAEARALAVERLAGSMRVLAAGLHPTSTLPIRVTDRDRYLGIAAECPWSVREGLPCGFHVHVAVPGADRALAVYNAARSFLPELAALAANSPFLGGLDTGLASARLKLNEALPRSGIPPAFRTWEDYAGFVSWGTSGGRFPDQTYLWWDLRLHPLHGTLEFRVADAQTRIEEAGAVAAVCQALAASLARRYDEGEALPVHPTHRIAENRYSGIRSGLEGTLVDLDSGTPLAARARIGAVLTSLEPVTEDLGSRNELLAAWTLLAENGAGRQRRIATESGLDGLVRRLVAESEQPAGHAAMAARLSSPGPLAG
jgi:carboxylate-amine ligase